MGLADIDDDAIVHKALENHAKVSEMLLGRGAGNQKVIDIRKTEGQFRQDLINEALESLSGVAESERHTYKLEQAKGRSDSSLANVVGMDRNLVVGPDKVDLGENGGTMEAGGEILEMRNRVAIGNSVVVKGAVISAGSPVARLFGYEVERGCPSAGRGSYNA